MKKIISFFVISFIIIIPLKINALTQIKEPIVCTNVDINNTKTCSVYANTDENGLFVILTEMGGAEITEIASNTNDWIASWEKVNGVYNVNLTGLDGTNVELLSFTYKVSGNKDSKVVVSLGNEQLSTADETTSNKQTGSSMPIMALALLTVFAGTAYITIKNKGKMYKI